MRGERCTCRTAAKVLLECKRKWRVGWEAREKLHKTEVPPPPFLPPSRFHIIPAVFEFPFCGVHMYARSAVFCLLYLAKSTHQQTRGLCIRVCASKRAHRCHCESGASGCCIFLIATVLEGQVFDLGAVPGPGTRCAGWSPIMLGWSQT